MLKFFIILFTAALTLDASLSLSQMKKEPRVALIIANEHYQNIQLKGVMGEAKNFKTFLQKRQFKVFLAKDLERSQLVKVIRDFTNAIKPNGIALFYYNGIAFQFQNKNYIITPEVYLNNEYQLQGKALDIAKIEQKISQKNARLNFLLLDGAKTTTLNKGFKSSKKGLASFKMPSKWHLFLAVRPNKINAKSGFTADFINLYKNAGVTVKAGKSKMAYALLTRADDFYFTIPHSLKGLDDKAYEKAVKVGTLAAYTAFLNAYPSSSHVAAARSNIKNIKYQQVKKSAQDRQKEQNKLAAAAAKKEADAKKKQEQKRLEAIAALRKKGIRVYEPEMVDVPKGSFYMGGQIPDNTPRHKVNFSKGFKVSKYEIRNKEYNQYLKAINKKATVEPQFMDKDQPATDVSWYGARNYAKWLSKYTGKKYRLPTEAQWEYFARAGNESKYIWGDEAVDVVKYAWMKRSASGLTHEYGLLQSNQWGIFDVFGNVSEWCIDDYELGYKHVDNKGSALIKHDSESKVLRGGNWRSTTKELASDVRDHRVPDFSDETTGFRLVLDE